MGQTVSCGYHLTAKPLSFGRGQSVVHTAAYNARTQLPHEREDRITRDYSGRSGLLFEGIFAPADAPDWTRDREQLWNRAEAAERQANGQPARNLTVAFPHELNQQQREWMLKDFVREQFARRGMIADAAMHEPDRGGDQRNFHAHILLTMRKLDGDHFAKTKCREWNSKTHLEAWREDWAERGARALERAGYGVEAERWRHGHQTLAEQCKAALGRGDTDFAASLEREATIHKGPKLSGIERRGGQSDRMDELQAILARNEIRIDLKALDQEMRQLEQEKAEQQRRDEQAKLEAAKVAEAARAEAAAKSLQEKQARAAQVAAKVGTEKQSALDALQRLARADAEALHNPGEKAFAKDAKEDANQIRQDKREESREATHWAKQAAWQARTNPRADAAAPVIKGLQVADRATGAVMKLADFVLDLLAGSSAPSPEKSDMRAFINDPAARKQQQLARLAGIQADREAASAIERIARDMEEGKALNAQDISKLTYQHQQQIRTFGDDAVKQMVDEARKRGESYWKGEERERER